MASVKQMFRIHEERNRTEVMEVMDSIVGTFCLGSELLQTKLDPQTSSVWTDFRAVTFYWNKLGNH